MRSPPELFDIFFDSVEETQVPVEAKAEIVINLAKSFGLADPVIRDKLRARLGIAAADHPYFHWRPRPRFLVGSRVRVIDGAPQVLGHVGEVQSIEDPRRLGVRGMSKAHAYSVVFDDQASPWGFREEQLESFDH